jgi:hypothetical protein
MTLIGEHLFILFYGETTHSGPGPPHCWGFTITLRHTTLRRTPLDEWSARRRYLSVTTHNIHKGHTSMPPAEFEPAVPASERPQNHAIDRVATRSPNYSVKILSQLHLFTTNVSLAELGSNPTLRGEAPATEPIDGRRWSEECKTLDRTSQRTHRILDVTLNVTNDV